MVVTRVVTRVATRVVTEGRNEGRNGMGGRACVGGVKWSHQK